MSNYTTTNSYWSAYAGRNRYYVAREKSSTSPIREVLEIAISRFKPDNFDRVFPLYLKERQYLRRAARSPWMDLATRLAPTIVEDFCHFFLFHLLDKIFSIRLNGLVRVIKARSVTPKFATFIARCSQNTAARIYRGTLRSLSSAMSF